MIKEQQPFLDELDWNVFAITPDHFEVATLDGEAINETEPELQATLNLLEQRTDTLSFAALAGQFNSLALCLCAAHMGSGLFMPWFQEDDKAHEDCKECKKRGLSHSHYGKNGKCPKGHQKPKSHSSRLAA